MSIILCLLTLSCATVPHTGRRQFNIVSDQQLNALAVNAFKEVKAQIPASQDTRLTELVKTVSDRISKAAEQMDKPGFAWDVRVLEKDIPNAFCLPGGKIVVFSGIVPFARNEAGLAAVIGHEVAHAVARHGAERMSQQLAIRGVLTTGGEIIKQKTGGALDQKTRLLLAAMGMGGTVGIILPFSRLHEFEADRIGMLYMAKAGYNPEAAIQLWQRMLELAKPPIPVWLSTHPPGEDRIEKLKAFLPEAMTLYNAAPEKRGFGKPL